MTSSEQQPRAPEADGDRPQDAKQHPPTNSTEALEAIARIIDPSNWRVLDGYLRDVQRIPNAGYDPDNFKDKASMAKAQAIHEALASTYREENERLRLALLGGEDAPGYAASLTLDQVLKSHRAYMQQVRDAANYDADRLREENERLREGLEKIAAGTVDCIMPFRAIGPNEMRSIARQALSTPSTETDQ